MIRRLQPGYNGGVGALHSHSLDDKPKVRYCQRCNDLFGVQARLGPRIRMMGPNGKIEPAQPGDDMYLTCRNCGSTYEKNQTKVEPALKSVKEFSDGKKGKVQRIEKSKKRIGRGNNPRLKGNKWEIKDEELKAELKSGSVLLAYSSNDPSEPSI
jgi:DNA-directed RNA polymerase subunit M/transcription elongation factor TFIIS